MLKAKVGYSEAVDSFSSGTETATMANFDNASVGLLFTSVVQDQHEILKGARSINSKAHIVGCTSSAAICTQDGYLNKPTGYSGMMSFSGDVKIGVAGRAKDADPRTMGRELAREAMKMAGKTTAPDFFFMTASPGEEEYYLLGIQDVIGRKPMFGGSTADNTVDGKWKIFCDNKIFDDGCAICFFYTNGYMKNLYTSGYEESKNVGIITKVKGERSLVEIDGVPALKKYCDWTGKDIKTVMGDNLLTASIFNPLGVKDPIGAVIAIRQPTYGNNNLSISTGAQLQENTAVIQMQATPESLLEASPKALKELNGLMDKEANSYFLVHSDGCRLRLQIDGSEKKIYSKIKRVTGDKEFLMIFTSSEYGLGDHSSNTVGNLSLSFTGFGE